MKKLIALMSLIASPAVAHPGHATLPGPAGHAETHIAMAAAASVVFSVMLVPSLLLDALLACDEGYGALFQLVH